MILASLVSVHVLGSLWFAVGDTEGGWVIEERLHEDVGEGMKSSSEQPLSKINPAERNRPILPYQNTKMILS